MKINLTDARIKRLRPNRLNKGRDHIIWDAKQPHFGIRIRENGAMRYIYLAHRDSGLKKITIGDVGKLSLNEARKRALALGNGGINIEAKPPCMTFKDFVNDVWWPNQSPHQKPSTRARNDHALKTQLLPAIGATPLDKVTKTHILNWFDRYSRRYPGGANRVMDTLKAILNYAVRSGVITKSPAKAITPNPRRKMTRFLSDDERQRLFEFLDGADDYFSTHCEAVRMLLFTGCRKSEILKLRWHEVLDKTLMLADSKTGARTVWLSDEASAVLERRRLRSLNSDYVFSSPRDPKKHLTHMTKFWERLREQVGLEDFRIHDLRHSFATEAIRQGVALPIVSKLLGHSSLAMTMRYTHANTADIEAAAERIGQSITRYLMPASQLAEAKNYKGC